MELIDLSLQTTHSATGAVPLVVQYSRPVADISLDRLVTPATILDIGIRRDRSKVSRADLIDYGVAGIAGCIICSGWFDDHCAGDQTKLPVLELDAAAYLLENGVSTIAADFPIRGSSADMLLHNNCVLVHCVSCKGLPNAGIVRLVALPLRLSDAFSAPARVIAMDDV